MKIAFWDNQLCERGTTQSLFDYAYYNIHILGNESLVLYPESENNVSEIEDKFRNEFHVIKVKEFGEVDTVLESEGCDLLYVIKFGVLDNLISKKVRTAVHCSFTCSQPHGDVYAAVSSWIRGYNLSVPVVPHIVKCLPESNQNWRSRYGIPEDAIVFGRYGGKDQFDIPFVQRAVYMVASKHPNIYFFFANTQKFCQDLKNIIHIDRITSEIDKRIFINTCDAMLHGRRMGETFGIAIAEFSMCNKPVIACEIGDMAHIHLLGEKGIRYRNANQLINILTTFDKEKIQNKDWNAYRDYSPEKVMKIFQKVFLTR